MLAQIVQPRHSYYKNEQLDRHLKHYFELLSRPGLVNLLAKAQAEYDIVLIDTPPATGYADAQSIVFRAGDALLVSRKDQTRIDDTERTVRDLSDASGRVVGTLMNAF